jgi:hypothetical protein
MNAEGGDKSYLHHQAVLIPSFFARIGLLLGSMWVYGPPFLSSFYLGGLAMMTISSLHLNIAIVRLVLTYP